MYNVMVFSLTKSFVNAEIAYYSQTSLLFPETCCYQSPDIIVPSNCRQFILLTM